MWILVDKQVHNQIQKDLRRMVRYDKELCRPQGNIKETSLSTIFQVFSNSLQMQLNIGLSVGVNACLKQSELCVTRLQEFLLL